MATTNLDPIPGFDAVAESRKWREATSALLGSLSREDRIAYLTAARTRYLAERQSEAALTEEEPCIVREDPPQK